METNNQRRGKNYQTYLQLQQDPDYYQVTFDQNSGGVSAVHREHSYDKQKGPYGLKRGEYELIVADVLRKEGHCIILVPDKHPAAFSEKHFDGTLDGQPLEIKAIEGFGQWAIRTKLYKAAQQGGQIVVLFFPAEELYSSVKIDEGWRLFCADPVSKELCGKITEILAIVVDSLVEIRKPPG